MELDLTNKLALVTGSTQGIGYAIAQTLVAEGARVIVNGGRAALVDEAARTLLPRDDIQNCDLQNHACFCARKRSGQL